MITEKDKEEAEIIYNLCVQIEAGLLVYDDLQKMVSRIRADVVSQATKEARELIKEMRSKLLVGAMQANNDMTMFRSIPVDARIITDLIKRTKEYEE